jgi:hypothetical protein
MQAIGTDTLADIPAVKVRLFADPAKSLDAARLQALESHKRATLTIALLVVQAARALDDLGEVFVRRMQHIHNAVAPSADLRTWWPQSKRSPAPGIAANSRGAIAVEC